MKVSTTILMASAIALASTIYARPTLLKRVADSAGAVACLIQMTVSPFLSPTCKPEFATDAGLVKGATLTDLTFDLRGAIPTIASTGVNVELLTAVGLPSIPVSRAKLNVAIMDGGLNVSSFASVWLSATTVDNKLDVTLTATALTFTGEQLTAFASFLKAVSTQPSHAFSLVGSVDVELSFSVAAVAKSLPGPFGAFVPSLPAKVVTIPGVGISVPITLGSLNNFGGEAQSAIASVSAVANVEGVDTVHFKMAVTNPSAVAILLGDVDFEVWSSDATPVLVGIATVANINIVPKGVNNFDVVLKASAGVALGSYFPAKDGLKLTVNGFDQSSKNTIVKDAVLNIKLSLVFKN